jgi:hypothetical protein
MSHANDIATALRERVAGIALGVGNAGRGFTMTTKTVSQASDVEDTMRATLDAVIAAERLLDVVGGKKQKAAAEGAVRLLRDALTEAIESSGCPSVETPFHTASLRRQQAFVSITDEALIPREYFVQPPPQLDKRALKSAMADGIEVPGASLATPNERTLAIRARN